MKRATELTKGDGTISYMRLESYMTMLAESAGTQTIEQNPRDDAQTKKYLRKKQDKLDRKRRTVTPFPEDKDPSNCGSECIDAAIVEKIDHDSSAPKDIDNIRKKGYKAGMRKKNGPRIPLNRPPGAVPLQDVQG